MADDPTILNVAEALLGCAVESLNETTAGAPERSTVAAASIGGPAWDDCCDGQLIVWWGQTFLSDSFPDPSLRKVACSAGYTAFDIHLEIVRCAPTQDNLGYPPTVAQLAESAALVHYDARAVWAGVVCCLYENRRRWESVVRGQVAVGPEGGCVGSIMTVTIGIVEGCGCD